MCVCAVLQDNNRAPGSPTSLRVPPNGGCEDLDMETEEEDDLRARGQQQHWTDTDAMSIFPQHE